MSGDPKKKLYKVHIEGAIFVMARTESEATLEAGYYLDAEKDRMVQEADLVEDIVKRFPRYVEDRDTEASHPWAADKGDDRSVGDHIKEIKVVLGVVTT